VVKYPGMTEDRLFQSTYRHRHHNPLECATCANDDGKDDVCDKAIEMSCQQLECDERELVLRDRPIQSSNPVIHFGLVASGDTVMKSGEDRDDIAARDGVVAFEMEGAGVWENFPGSLVIKGVCDYADSHKNKRWQGYAAATAAAVTKGFLENWGTGMHSYFTFTCWGGSELKVYIGAHKTRYHTSSNTTISWRKKRTARERHSAEIGRNGAPREASSITISGSKRTESRSDTRDM
jgi:hypothetical protein